MTTTEVRDIPAIGHDEGMRLAAVEYERYLDLMRSLTPEEWTRRTVCPPWDVRQLSCHVLGFVEGWASLRENAHQMRHGRKIAKAKGYDHWIHGVNELEVEERADVDPATLIARYEKAVPGALKGRHRFPFFLRPIKTDFGPPIGKRPMGSYLVDVVLTRDTWMHRVDVCRDRARAGAHARPRRATDRRHGGRLGKHPWPLLRPRAHRSRRRLVHEWRTGSRGTPRDRRRRMDLDHLRPGNRHRTSRKGTPAVTTTVDVVRNLTTVSGMAYFDSSDTSAIDEESGLPVDFLTAQPYQYWDKAREQGCPVVRADGMSAAGRPGYQVVTFDEAVTVLRDPETFSSSINMEHIGEFMGELIVGLDGDEHRAYRNIVAHAFRRSQIEHWDDDLVKPTIDRLLDEIVPLGRADLVRALTSKYPVWIICGIVGVPVEDAGQMHRWSEQINTGPLAPEQGHAAVRAMTEYLQPLLDDRRANPRDDLLSELVHTTVDGQALTEARLWGFLRLLLPAGAETTYRVMGNLITALLTRPGQLERVVADRSLVPVAIEETLRWETSIPMVARVATRRRGVGRVPRSRGSIGRSDLRLCESRRGSLPRPGRVEPRPGVVPPPRVRHRPASVPRDAPRAPRARDGHQRDARPHAEPPPRPRHARPRDRRRSVPRPERHPRPLGPSLTKHHEPLVEGLGAEDDVALTDFAHRSRRLG